MMIMTATRIIMFFCGLPQLINYFFSGIICKVQVYITQSYLITKALNYEENIGKTPQWALIKRLEGKKWDKINEIAELISQKLR